MSDMYLVLRRRLETVATQWVTIESGVLREARTRRGLSYESLARQIPVAAKTYERWEKRGRVPTWHIVKVAELLDLEIERPDFAPRPVVTVGAEEPVDLARVLAAVQETRDEIRRVAGAVEELREALPPATQGRRRAS